MNRPRLFQQIFLFDILEVVIAIVVSKITCVAGLFRLISSTVLRMGFFVTSISEISALLFSNSVRCFKMVYGVKSANMTEFFLTRFRISSPNFRSPK